MIVFGKQLTMSSTKQKGIGFGFFFKPRDKLQQLQQQPQQQQQNDHRPIEEIQCASSESMLEIAMNYQPHQLLKTFKFSQNVYGKQKRSFQRTLVWKYPWVDYDVEEVSLTFDFYK